MRDLTSKSRGSSSSSSRGGGGKGDAQTLAWEEVDGDSGEVCFTKLYPTCLFGETALLDPWHGRNPATIVAETQVEVLMISKKQFNAADLTKQFIEVQTHTYTHKA